MAERRIASGLRWFFLLLLAELALFALIYVLRGESTNRGGEAPPPTFSRVQALNLQSLINAKGFPCPTPPALRYEQRGRGVAIVATCRLANGEQHRFEIDFKGHVRPL